MRRPYSVLFVCSGNTCRSPMAEAIARAELARLGIEGVEVSSAGLDAVPSSRTSRHAVAAATGLGAELRSRAARQLTERQLARADLVLTMTESQKMRVSERWPGACGRTSTLAEFSGSARGGIDDPAGGDQGVYLACALALRREVRKAIPRLRKALNRRRANDEDGGRSRSRRV